MNLTLDEARHAVVTSARRLLERCSIDDPFSVACMLWGAGGLDDLDAADRLLAQRHRQLLDRLTAAGYGAETADELEGVTSAAGLDDGRLDRHAF